MTENVYVNKKIRKVTSGSEIRMKAKDGKLIEKKAVKEK